MRTPRLVFGLVLMVAMLLGACGSGGALAATAATTAAGAIIKPLFCSTLRSSYEFAERTWCGGPPPPPVSTESAVPVTEPVSSGGESTTEP